MKARPYPMKKHTFHAGHSMFYDNVKSGQKRRASERDMKVQDLEAKVDRLEGDISKIKKEIGI